VTSLLHFTTFIRACVETDRRNKAAPTQPLFLVPATGQTFQPVYVLPSGQQATKLPYVVQANTMAGQYPAVPQAAHLSGYYTTPIQQYPPQAAVVQNPATGPGAAPHSQTPPAEADGVAALGRDAEPSKYLTPPGILQQGNDIRLSATPTAAPGAGTSPA
jgi:hypothetical protein